MKRSLPPSFDALAIEISVNRLEFDDFLLAVQANIELRKKRSSSAGKTVNHQAHVAVISEQENRFSNNGPSRGSEGLGGRVFRGGRVAEGGVVVVLIIMAKVVGVIIAEKWPLYEV